jgi:hypothetical protein
VKEKYKPGPGWKYLAGAVWENEAGTRVHMLGMCRILGSFIPAQGNEYLEAARLIRINGGNRRRGLMAWARRNEEGEG